MEGGLLLVTVGVLFLAGLALDRLGRIVHVPRVTLLILLGTLLGPPVLDVLPQQITRDNELFSALALTMVAFLLGSALGLRSLARHGREILSISLSVVIVCALMVSGGLYLLGAPLPVALLLGGIAAATDPAATLDVVRQSGRQTPFTGTLMGIVAIDDAWGLLVFSLLISLAALLAGSPGDGVSPVMAAVRESVGGIVLGVLIGLPAALLTGRIKPGEPSLVEALGLVCLVAGLSLALEVSFLLAGMACGMVVVNLARHHGRPFHEIERIEWPFLLVFFIIAGASLQVGALAAIGVIGAAYCALRILSRLVGGALGAALIGLPVRRGVLTGTALMPQAGVAIGMALVGGTHFPEHAGALMTIAIASTIFFEIIGPVMTQLAIQRAARDGEQAGD